MNPIVIVVIVVTLLAVLLIVALSMRSRQSEEIEERLGIYAQPSSLIQLSEELEREERERQKKEKEKSVLVKAADKAVGETKWGQGARAQLARADLKLTVGEYFMLHIVSVIGMAFLSLFLLFPLQPVQAIIAAGIGFFLPRLYVARKQSQRLKKFEQQLPDLLSMWVNSLRAGYSVLQALEAISREMPEPTSTEIQRVVREVQLGIPMEQALDHMLERVPSAELDLCFTAVNIQREVGGNLAEILEVIGHTIRERIKLFGEIRVLTAQGRITGWLISALPIILGVLLSIINWNYMRNLFTNPGCGWPMLAVGAFMIVAGMAAIQRIVSIDI
ncbi:MAG: secretion system protein [Candidatus Thermofonsia Clade 1 bacterium]|jgi:tight adherence protein B|uniref:Secretion system protein n=1 Tax=Candidatus Thermofonsia Clade 1 bacterium TaxID=2364210 RepID=A0A2M8Q0T2_9CHLR|nr:MAG: secretion system protein [Candidatus Thermofonsia Clade 1 bacterium]PJF43379.1 MAG: secretion system protein [Candidatus Thermofonsia Clade 1 bacterium]RMF50577.1 MAG: secretion system protein [Chloroflexota bacterium]